MGCPTDWWDVLSSGHLSVQSRQIWGARSLVLGYRSSRIVGGLSQELAVAFWVPAKKTRGTLESSVSPSACIESRLFSLPIYKRWDMGRV